MNEEILNYIILLEKALADFYGGLQREDHMEKVKATLAFQETHSREHAKKITELKETHPIPTLENSLLLDYHNSLIDEIRETIQNENNLKKILQVLAQSEEKIGDAYKKLAASMRERAAFYQAIAEEIDAIGDEEYQHRDLLLIEKS